MRDSCKIFYVSCNEKEAVVNNLRCKICSCNTCPSKLQ